MGYGSWEDALDRGALGNEKRLSTGHCIDSGPGSSVMLGHMLGHGACSFSGSPLGRGTTVHSLLLAFGHSGSRTQQGCRYPGQAPSGQPRADLRTGSDSDSPSRARSLTLLELRVRSQKGWDGGVPRRATQ